MTFGYYICKNYESFVLKIFRLYLSERKKESLKIMEEQAKGMIDDKN